MRTNRYDHVSKVRYRLLELEYIRVRSGEKKKKKKERNSEPIDSWLEKRMFQRIVRGIYVFKGNAIRDKKLFQWDTLECTNWMLIRCSISSF